MNKILLSSILIYGLCYTNIAYSKELTPNDFIYNINQKISKHKIDLSNKKDLASVFENSLSTEIYRDSQLDNPSDSDQKIDFNIFYGGQDLKVSNFKVMSATFVSKKYKVNVTFDNLNSPQAITYTVIPTTKNEFRIYDIEYKNNFTLRGVLLNNN